MKLGVNPASKPAEKLFTDLNLKLSARACGLLAVCLLAACFFCLLSCAGKESAERTDLVIAAWNVQNLFDNVADGTEYSEYTRAGGWNGEAYRARLAQTASVLNSGVLAKAEIMVLNEIENENVARDLMAELGKRGFSWYAVSGQEGGAISLGIISSLPMEDATVHAVEGSRPVVCVRFRIDSTDLFVLAVHAKSNSGEPDEVVRLRDGLGSAVDSVVSEIKREYPFALIVLAGDFNENARDGHVVHNFGAWRCFWEDYGFPEGVYGSYFYDDKWYCYDNILLSADFLDSGGVMSDGLLTDAQGHPNRWDRLTMNGVSDHLPVWVRIRLP